MQPNGKTARRRAPRKKGKKAAGDRLRKSEVELLRNMFEFEFWSIEDLATKFEITAARAKLIVTYKQDS